MKVEMKQPPRTLSSVWWLLPGKHTQARFSSTQMLGSGNLHFCFLKLKNSTSCFINPMVLTCFVNINKLSCEHWLSCIQNETLGLSVPQMVFFFLWSSVQTRIHDSSPSTAGSETGPILLSLIYFAGVSHLDRAHSVGMFCHDEFSFHGDKNRLPGALGFKIST